MSKIENTYFFVWEPVSTQKKVYICVVVCEMSCVKTVCLKSSDFTGADCQLELPSEGLYGILLVLSVVSIVFAVGVVVWDWTEVSVGLGWKGCLRGE